MSRGAAIALLAAALLGLCAYADEPPLRDPMRPYSRTPGGAPQVAAPRELELTTVLIGPSRRVAVINGRIYRENDWVDGAQILRIEAQAVHLRRDGQDMVVRLIRRRTDSETKEGDSAS